DWAWRVASGCSEVLPGEVLRVGRRRGGQRRVEAAEPYGTLVGGFDGQPGGQRGRAGQLEEPAAVGGTFDEVEPGVVDRRVAVDDGDDVADTVGRRRHRRRCRGLRHG